MLNDQGQIVQSVNYYNPSISVAPMDGDRETAKLFIFVVVVVVVTRLLKEYLITSYLLKEYSVTSEIGAQISNNPWVWYSHEIPHMIKISNRNIT